MMEEDDKKLRQMLQHVIPPVNLELKRDLWPEMLRKLDASGRTLPWYDWALIGGTAGILVVFPRLILLFAYHF